MKPHTNTQAGTASSKQSGHATPPTAPPAFSCPLTPSPPGEVSLSEGGGGQEMQALIRELRSRLSLSGAWTHQTADAAISAESPGRLVFTTDSYVVTPLFFPGGDIGKIAVCGTINDLLVMGADPLGLSLSLIIEEGFPKKELFAIIDSIEQVSRATGVPVVTGDTKVLERGAIDKLVITTSGVGKLATLIDSPPQEGDLLIVSGTLGDHGAALLAQRFALETTILSDSKPLIEELSATRTLLKQAKDVTRGGIAAVLHELAGQHHVGFRIFDEQLPLREETRVLTGLLGVDPLSLACEGRFVAIVAARHKDAVLARLRSLNPDACVIGDVTAGAGVTLVTRFGERPLPPPSGVLVPRIC